MCERAVSAELHTMESVLDQYKSQQMCAKAFGRTPCTLKMVTDLFVTPKMFGNIENDDLITQ